MASVYKPAALLTGETHGNTFITRGPKTRETILRTKISLLSSSTPSAPYAQGESLKGEGVSVGAAKELLVVLGELAEAGDEENIRNTRALITTVRNGVVGLARRDKELLPSDERGGVYRS
jgi:hypothetical protein